MGATPSRPAACSDSDVTLNLVSFPQTVLAAGVLWTVFGGLLILQMAVAVIGSVASGSPRRDEAIFAASCCAFPVVPIGAGFVWVGIQTIKGKARSTKGNVLGSVIFGVLNIGLAGALMAEHPVQGTLSLIAGCGLVIAGFLALHGRYHYRVWVVANQRADASTR